MSTARRRFATCSSSRSKRAREADVHWRSSSGVGAEVAEVATCLDWCSWGTSWCVSLFNSSSHKHVLVLTSPSSASRLVFGFKIGFRDLDLGCVAYSIRDGVLFTDFVSCVTFRPLCMIGPPHFRLLWPPWPPLVSVALW